MLMRGLRRSTRSAAVRGEARTTGYPNVAKGGLGKWFGEKWVDVKTGKPCGRSGAKDTRGYPACRPKAAAAKMTSSQKQTMAARKTGPARQSWPVTPSGRKK